MRRSALFDLLLVVFVAALGYGAALSALDQYRSAGRRVFFYQSQFGPAVSFACGFGFRNVNHTRIQAMADFLEERSDRMNCSAIGPQSPYVPLETFQGISRYLELSVGMVWHVRGVAWSALDPLFGILYAISIALTYGLFRLAAPPLPAAVAAIWMAYSPLQIANLPALRDFAKAPFVLGLLLLVGFLLKSHGKENRTLLLCAAAGVTAGIGLGFRNDLLLLIPVLMLAILVPPVAGDARPFVARGARIAVFTMSCAVCASPILAAYSRGSNTGHVILLGMTTPFDGGLNVRRPIYDVGYLYNDSYMYVVVRSFAERVLSASGPMQIGSADYDRASMQYLGVLIRQVPADVLARVYASIWGVFRAPFDPTLADTSFLRGPLNIALSVRRQATAWLAMPAALAALALLVYIAAAGRRDLATGALIVGVLAAAAALQFHPRHFFYLEFAVWWPLMALMDRAFRRFRGIERADAPTWNWRLAATILVAIPLAAWCLLVAVRIHQQRAMTAALERLLHADSIPVQLTEVPIAGGKVRLSPPTPPVTGDLAHPVATAYYAFSFGGPSCDHLSLEPTFRYASSELFADFTHDIPIDLQAGDGTAIVYTTSYHAEAPYRKSAFSPIEFITTDFAGIELPAAQASCVTAARRIRNEQTPAVLMNVVLTPGWQHARLYARLGWESERPLLARTIAVPPSLSRRRAMGAPDHEIEGAIDSIAKNVRRERDALVVHGQAAGAFTYLVTFAPRGISGSRLAMARGELHDGGITIGLIRDGAWVAATNVVQPGPFTVLVETPAGGTYQLVIANCLTGGQTSNRVTITKVGWVKES